MLRNPIGPNKGKSHIMLPLILRYIVTQKTMNIAL